MSPRVACAGPDEPSSATTLSPLTALVAPKTKTRSAAVRAKPIKTPGLRKATEQRALFPYRFFLSLSVPFSYGTAVRVRSFPSPPS